MYGDALKLKLTSPCRYRQPRYLGHITGLRGTSRVWVQYCGVYIAISIRGYKRRIEMEKPENIKFVSIPTDPYLESMVQAWAEFINLILIQGVIPSSFFRKN